MWFDELDSPFPSLSDLQRYVRLTLRFLKEVMFDEENRFSFLWRGNDLQELARTTFMEDAVPSGEQLIGVLRSPDVEKYFPDLQSHGLFGAPVRFKFEVVKWIARRLFEALRRNPLSIRSLLKKLLDAIDVILDSLIAALGVGGALKEFKDALAALAIETPE